MYSNTAKRKGVRKERRTKGVRLLSVVNLIFYQRIKNTPFMDNLVDM